MMTTDTWLAFTPDTTIEHARAVFLARYGREAAEVLTFWYYFHNVVAYSWHVTDGRRPRLSERAARYWWGR